MEGKTTPVSAVYQGVRRVLVVDDDPTTAAGVLSMIGGWGHRASAVPNTKEALQFLRNNPVDLLVMHLVLPAKVFGPMLAQLAENPALARIPVLISNAYQDTSPESEKIKKKYAGRLALHWYSRPFPTAVLKQLLDEMTARERATLQATQAIMARSEVDLAEKRARPLRWKPVVGGMVLALVVLTWLFFRLSSAQYRQTLSKQQSQTKDNSKHFDQAVEQVVTQIPTF